MSTERTPLREKNEQQKELTEDEKLKFNKYLKKGREYFKDGENKKALKYWVAACDICPLEKLLLKVKDLQAKLKNEDDLAKDVSGTSQGAVPADGRITVVKYETPKVSVKEEPENHFETQVIRKQETAEGEEKSELRNLIIIDDEPDNHKKKTADRELQNRFQFQKHPDQKSYVDIKPSHNDEEMMEDGDEQPVVSSVRKPAKQSSTEQSLEDESQKEKEALEFYKRAKEAVSQDNLKKALKLFRKTYALVPDEKFKRKILKIEAHLSEFPESEEVVEDVASSSGPVQEGMVELGLGFFLNKDLFENLYTHQRQGVLWMYQLYTMKKGGILADDMGLGKTIQVIAFLSGMFDADLIKAVLIVLPVAVIMNWEREFEKWAPGIAVSSFHQESRAAKSKTIKKVHRQGGVILTSYGMLVRQENIKQIAEIDGKTVVWDHVILDEGHKIKNASTKCSKGVHSIRANNRLILTGTPVQNNLKELWTLFNWTNQGTLLGSQQTFKFQFDNPITRSRQKDATNAEKRHGLEIAQILKQRIQPYFLRRTKAMVAHREQHEEVDSQQEQLRAVLGGKAPKMPTMTRKNDFVCWMYLSKAQKDIYRSFLDSEDVKELLNSTKSPLVALTQLKKICDHPRLLTTGQCIKLGIHVDHSFSDDKELPEEFSKLAAASRIQNVPDDVIVNESGKMVFLMQLLDHLKAEGHRTLIFSQHRKILDIIQKVLTSRGHRVARLDGTITKLAEREDIITRFKEHTVYSVFLLTTQVGGVGLTLTSADRVVIFDPSWNPATDNQAVDRAFRIGQTRDVVIYRLITCGSVEEKIYRRQVFKDSITKQTTGDAKNPYRHFTKQDLHELFKLDDTNYSVTQRQLAELHIGQRKSNEELDMHLAYLHSLPMFGVSDHDLLFNKDEVDSGDDDVEGNSRIQTMVAGALRLLSVESEETQQRIHQQGGFYRPDEVFNPRKKTASGSGIGMPWKVPGSEVPARYNSDDAYDSDENSQMDPYSDEHPATATELKSTGFYDRSHPAQDTKPIFNDVFKKPSGVLAGQVSNSSSVIDLCKSPAAISQVPQTSHTPRTPSESDLGRAGAYMEWAPPGMSEEEQLKMALQLSMMPSDSPEKYASPGSRSWKTPDRTSLPGSSSSNRITPASHSTGLYVPDTDTSDIMDTSVPVGQRASVGPSGSKDLAASGNTPRDVIASPGMHHRDTAMAIGESFLDHQAEDGQEEVMNIEASDDDQYENMPTFKKMATGLSSSDSEEFLEAPEPPPFLSQTSKNKRRSVSAGIHPISVVDEPLGSQEPLTQQEELDFSPFNGEFSAPPSPEPEDSSPLTAPEESATIGYNSFVYGMKKLNSTSIGGQLNVIPDMMDEDDESNQEHESGSNDVTRVIAGRDQQSTDHGLPVAEADSDEEEDGDEDDDDDEELTEEDEQRWIHMMTEAKKAYKEGNYSSALKLVYEALPIFKDENSMKFARIVQQKAMEQIKQ